ncbi:MAG: hypothetical protein WAM44_13115, partial [Chthoniobacterales bacterium]
ELQSASTVGKLRGFEITGSTPSLRSRPRSRVRACGVMEYWSVGVLHWAVVDRLSAGAVLHTM